jgi:hypothetical protein
MGWSLACAIPYASLFRFVLVSAESHTRYPRHGRVTTGPRQSGRACPTTVNYPRLHHESWY